MYPISRRHQRLALRELTADDVEAVLAIYGSSTATEHLSFEPRSRDEVARLLCHTITAATITPRSEFSLAVTEQTTSRLIGFARLALDPHQQQAATIGFALRPDTWGVGYGLETVQLLLGLGFDELELHRIWGARSPENAASARTMIAAGMREEYTIREHVKKAGRWRDSVVHTILDREWKVQQSPEA
ncbi:GNAT family N-acetyltransferase [Streptomyces sp. ASQP_92]|uniref:GNAT family N-acetyltransferase n=1 Tax=Streptomyces sp. ASQP_92 TaxID=2979116 RepID=UPI0021C243EE|nr:GNAT family protein [Streptomyces sp. ASQP_92]MCT9093493.1 GNAT family N-acetyltransferase [Streptomyces sp. ASQP_92]